jgi:hypothetical protein
MLTAFARFGEHAARTAQMPKTEGWRRYGNDSRGSAPALQAAAAVRRCVCCKAAGALP